MTTHAHLLDRHRAVLPRWLALYYDEPIELVSGKGCRVTDAQGREYLDFFGGILTTMAITGNRGWSASSLSPLQVSYVANGDPLRGPLARLGRSELVAACVEDLRQVIEMTAAGDVACLIAEPIQGVGGFVTPPDGL